MSDNTEVVGGENKTGQEGQPEQIQFDKTGFFETRTVNEVHKAEKHGWKDFDKHLEKGGDPDDWVSAEVFNERGKSIKYSMKLKSNHNQQLKQALKDVNEVHTVQMDIKLADLMKERKIAIEDGESDKVSSLDDSINKTKQGIDKLKQTETSINQVPQADIMHEQQWSENNPWFNERSPKGSYARELASAALSSGYHGADLTNHIETEIAKAFPLKNTNRDKPGVSDKGRRGLSGKEALTMKSLTSEEMQIVTSLKNRGKSEEDCLKMVKLSRE